MKKIIIKTFQSLFLEKLFFNSIFLKPLIKETKDINTVLELGAGKNSYLNLIENNLHITALDINQDSINFAKEKGLYNDYVLGNVLNIDSQFSENSFDMVAAFDLIEHLTKDQGYKLIENMVKIARKKVIIYTPNGFLKQDPFDNNPFQEHLSGWEYSEMKEFNFKIYGVNGYKKLRGMYSKPIIKPALLGNFIANISWLFLKVFKLEKKSFAIMCFKEVEE